MKIVLFRFKPSIIGVTGSVGKTSAKEAIYTVLKSRYKVAKSPKSYNSEIGVPLAMLGLPSPFRSPMGWFINIFAGLIRAFSFKPYPEIFVLEMGIDRPGNLDMLLKIIRPSTAVITAIGEVPVHVEYFQSPQEVIDEKSKILRPLDMYGYAILNFDDPAVRGLADKTPAIVLTYGFDEKAHVQASNYAVTLKKEEGHLIPLGITFKLIYKGNVLPIRISGVIGKQHVYAALAAAATGISRNINLLEIGEALSHYEASPGRLKLIEGMKHSIILDDTYNASPLSMKAALEVLEELPTHAKIAVLGDMLEIGKYTVQEHRAIGVKAGTVCSLLLVVGTRAKFIAEGAITAGMDKEKIFEFSNSNEAGKKLHELISRGTIVLIKGSQAMRMEKITEAVMADHTQAETLLVRQESYWKKKNLHIHA